MSEIKRGGVARNAKLAGLAGGMAGRAALGFGKRLTGASKDEVNAELVEKAANQLFTVLGELKGGAMKVGQALSVMEAAVPEQFGKPYREALTKLQKDAPPLPADKVHRVLDSQLGTKWRERFQSFDDTPVASASIGQVHSAVWSDGRRVAVKVQYPGADEAVRADLKTLRMLTSLFKQVVPGADVKSIIDELIERWYAPVFERLQLDAAAGTAPLEALRAASHTPASRLASRWTCWVTPPPHWHWRKAIGPGSANRPMPCCCATNCWPGPHT